MDEENFNKRDGEGVQLFIDHGVIRRAGLRRVMDNVAHLDH
jgi:hypothetical protein